MIFPFMTVDIRKILITASCVCLVAFGCGKADEPLREVKIQGVMGRYLQLEDGQIVAMVGIFVAPPGEKNFFAKVYQSLHSQLIGKTVQLRTVEEKHHVGYPYVDLVEVFVNGVNLNHHFLEVGIAFFNEDHWNKKEKEVYRELAQKAKNERVGVWVRQGNLEITFLRPKKGRFIHYPDCPHVKNLKWEEAIRYYTPLPRSPFMAARLAYFCDFCRPLFDKEYQKREEAQKVKLAS